MLAVLGRDGLDLACVGEAPPIFSQATDMPVVYVGYAPAAPAGEAILVARDSPIRTLADLKGRRVAVSRGSNGHFLLLQALAKGGLGPDDVTPVFLAPQDGWIAFERGSVDAWAIWDPFLSVAQSATQARALVDGRGLAGNRYFYISTRKFAADHADLLRTVLGIINDSDLWSKAHPDETIALLARRTGVTRGGLKAAVERMGYGVTALDPATVADQQLVADAFARLNLLPGPLSIADAVWHGPN
jgi:sulfonate transport system substrate-binding protein